ncbi:MAG: peptidylprolyl isomerase [Candidatus Woesearchaeota archaeon]|nr:peptidylprolyl isomerase [Candidatus Woesearchaeota archaeon]
MKAKKQEISKKVDSDNKKELPDEYCGCDECSTRSHSSSGRVESGSHVAISYIGTLDDGTVFDRTDENNPLMFTVGGKELLPAFEDNIIGMKENEEKSIKLSSKDAYGDFNENLIQQMPKSFFEGKVEIKEGLTIMFANPAGQRGYGKIMEISDDSVKVDFNHPLAGKSLNFRIKVLQID